MLDVNKNDIEVSSIKKETMNPAEESAIQDFLQVCVYSAKTGHVFFWFWNRFGTSILFRTHVILFCCFGSCVF
jgi:hypothetical protein